MNFTEVFLIGVGLSMDAFAAAVCKGLSMRKFKLNNALVIAVFFGGFQAAMPLLGWILGRQFESYIKSVDHWVAFTLLAFIGGKMIYDVIKGEEETAPVVSDKINYREILTLAVATSIDALAVGISFAFLSVNILWATGTIGITTFVLSAVGVALGNRFGAKYEKKATFTGGMILILIGLKILLEHLGVLSI